MRGAWIREQLLCDELGEPPANIDDSPITGGDNGSEVVTVRDATEARSMTEKTCIGCHTMINTLGYPFEQFDAIGRAQPTEVVSGAPVDTAVVMEHTDFDGPIADSLALSEALGSSHKARACFARKWQTHALGGEPPESCEETGAEAFVESGNMQELFIAIISSDAFRYVNVGE